MAAAFGRVCLTPALSAASGHFCLIAAAFGRLGLTAAAASGLVGSTALIVAFCHFCFVAFSLLCLIAAALVAASDRF